MRNKVYLKQKSKERRNGLINTLLLSFLIIIVMFNKPERRVTFLVILAVVILFMIFIRKKTKNKLYSLLKNETPDKLLAEYDKAKKATVESRVGICCSKAIICCYYGDFEGALEELKSLEWNGVPPVLQSIEISAKVVTSYLRDNDFKEGLRLANIAKDLCYNAEDDKGVNKFVEFHNIYVYIGELLIGEYEEEKVIYLEGKFENSAFDTKLFIAWGLANIYHKFGREADSINLINYCKETAPYCRVLHNVIK